jgi:hypothetical protein
MQLLKPEIYAGVKIGTLLVAPVRTNLPKTVLKSQETEMKQLWQEEKEKDTLYKQIV